MANTLKITTKHILTFILIAYAVVITPFVDEGLRNYLVIIAGILGGILVLILNLRVALSLLLIAIMLFYMIIVVLVTDFSQLGSVGLSAVYALGYLAVAGLIDRFPDKKEFAEDVFRKIIYAFAIVSVVQMMASLTGLPVPNLMLSKGLWSYNSLSFEPSQLGRVVGISMLAYLIISRPVGKNENLLSLFTRHRKVFIAFFVTMILSGSAMAATAIPLVIIMSRSLRMAFLLLAFVCMAWPIISIVDYEPLSRSVMLFSSLSSNDLDTLFEVEGSGASRIAPALIYLSDALPNEIGFWIGYGSEGLARFFQYKIPGFGDIVAAGFFPGFAVVYGVFGMALFIWMFLLRFLNTTVAPLVIFWVIFFTSVAWNTQIFWYGLIVIKIVHSIHRGFATRRVVHAT